MTVVYLCHQAPKIWIPFDKKPFKVYGILNMVSSLNKTTEAMNRIIQK